jgi:carboxymethylenebutenolidase
MLNTTLTSRHDGFALPCYRAAAAGQRKGSVVVIQEIFGVTDHIVAMADRFAAAGYDAIAPSLYDRVEANFHAAHDDAGIALARRVIDRTPMSQVAADVQTCIDAMAAPVHITGFCYGGGVAWMAAGRCTGLASASGFYGRIINMMLDVAPRIPVILHYGRHDAAIPQAMVDEVQAAHPSVPIFVYDAGHGFCREGSADFHAPSRDLAMARTLDHFAKHGSVP